MEANRTFIGSVVCVDLVGYSKRSVAQQDDIKQAFNKLLVQVLKRVPPEDRIILDTGDGAAISFLGDPEQSLAIGIRLRDTMNGAAARLGGIPSEGGPVRIGINLGPLRLAADMNGHPKIIGDGINVAEKICGFAQPGQVVVSRPFHDVVSRITDKHRDSFHYEGTRTDKNVRDHEIYSVRPDAKEAPAPPKAKTLPPVPPKAPPDAQPRGEGVLVRMLRDSRQWGTIAVVFVGLIVWELVQVAGRVGPAQPETTVAKAPEVVKPPEPAKPLEAARVEAPKKAEPMPEPPRPVPVEPKPVEKKVEPKAPEKKPEPEKPKAPEKKTEPEKPKAPEKKPEPEKKAEPEKRAPAPEAKPVEKKAPPPETKKVDEPPRVIPQPRSPAPAQVAPPPTVAPAPIVQPTEPMPAPREEPKAAPAPSAPPPPTTVATPVSRAPFTFPLAAINRGITSGTVRARLTINAAGNVTNVDILAGDPPLLFNRAATTGLEAWKFNPGADKRTYEIEVEFKR